MNLFINQSGGFIMKLVWQFFFIIALPLLLATSSYAKPTSISTADHSKFEELNREFTKAEEVTKACLKCHNKAGKQFQNTIHWKWEVDCNNRKLGKKHVINNF